MIQEKQIDGLLVGSVPFVFVPGAPTVSLSENSFNTWAALQAASASFSRIQVQVDDTFSSPATIPSGSWPNVGELIGSSTGSTTNGLATNVLLANGCVLPNCLNYGQLNITTAATSVYPMIVSDNQVLYLDGCSLQKTGAIGSIHVTPGDGVSSPTLACSGSQGIATFIQSNTIDIEPSVASNNGLVVDLTNSLLDADVFTGIGTFAADVDVFVTILDTPSNGYIATTSATTQPGVASVSWTDLSLTDVVRFGAQTVTSSPGTPRSVAAWQNATDFALVGGVPSEAQGVALAQPGLRTLLRASLLAPNLSDLGKTATIQLWRSGVAVPGATVVVDLGNSSVQAPGTIFADVPSSDDIYNVTVEVSAALVGSATQLLVMLT